MNDNQKTLSIIGGGLAGLLSAFYLIHEKKSRSLPLPKINLFVSDLFPACTLSSTATVALRGTSKGLSDLGDDLVESFREVENFIHEFRPAGVIETKLKTYNHPMSNSFEKIEKRYHNHPKTNETHGYVSYEEKVFLFSPYKFSAWLYKMLLPHVQFHQETVVKVEEGKLSTLSGKMFEADQILLAAGAYNKILFSHEKLQKSSALAGSYLEFALDLGDVSFAQTYNELNCLYLHEDKKLLFGSASQDGFCLSADLVKLKERYDEWQNAHLTRLPSFDSATIRTGIREKGKKREAYLHHLNKNKTVSALGGLYKNGYSLGFLYSKKFSKNFL